jgi:phosphoserine phosphatase
LNPKNIGVFFDFDETLLDIESSRLGFDHLLCTDLEIGEDGLLTGRAKGPHLPQQ